MLLLPSCARKSVCNSAARLGKSVEVKLEKLKGVPAIEPENWVNGCKLRASKVTPAKLAWDVPLIHCTICVASVLTVTLAAFAPSKLGSLLPGGLAGSLMLDKPEDTAGSVEVVVNVAAVNERPNGS